MLRDKKTGLLYQKQAYFYNDVPDFFI